VSGKMVLDTGTGVTVVDQQFASKTKLGRRSLKMYGGDAAGNFRQEEVGNVSNVSRSAVHKSAAHECIGLMSALQAQHLVIGTLRA